MSEAVLNFPVENFMPFLLGYALYFEYLTHVAVALNRFSVISKAAKNEVTLHGSDINQLMFIEFGMEQCAPKAARLSPLCTADPWRYNKVYWPLYSETNASAGDIRSRAGRALVFDGKLCSGLPPHTA